MAFVDIKQVAPTHADSSVIQVNCVCFLVQLVMSVPLITTRDRAGTSCLNEGPFAKKVHESVTREDVSFYSFFPELVKYAKECNPVLLLGKGTCYGTCLCG